MTENRLEQAIRFASQKHADYAELGDRLWERFNAPVEKQSWYYSKIQDALYGMQDDPKGISFSR